MYDATVARIHMYDLTEIALESDQRFVCVLKKKQTKKHRTHFPNFQCSSRIAVPSSAVSSTSFPKRIIAYNPFQLAQRSKPSPSASNHLVFIVEHKLQNSPLAMSDADERICDCRPPFGTIVITNIPFGLRNNRVGGSHHHQHCCDVADAQINLYSTAIANANTRTDIASLYSGGRNCTPAASAAASAAAAAAECGSRRCRQLCAHSQRPQTSVARVPVSCTPSSSLSVSCSARHRNQQPQLYMDYTNFPTFH